MMEEKKDMTNQKKDTGKAAAAGAGAGLGLGTILILLAAATGVGLLAIGGMKLLDYLNKRNEQQQALLEEYMSEMEELEAYQRELANKGTAPSEQDSAVMDTMIREINFKEQAFNQPGFLDKVRDLIFDTFVIAIPTAVGVTVVGYVVYKLWKNRPPRTPTYKDPKTGQEFRTEEEMDQHLQQTYLSQTSPALIAQAESIFRSLPLHIQESVVARSSDLSRSHYPLIESPWSTLTGMNWVNVAAALVAVGAITLVIGPAGAAALLVL